MLMLMLLLSVVGNFIPGVSAGGAPTIIYAVETQTGSVTVGQLLLPPDGFIVALATTINNTSPLLVNKVSLYLRDAGTSATGTYTVGFMQGSSESSWWYPIDGPMWYSSYIAYTTANCADITADGWYDFTLPCSIPIPTSTSTVYLVLSQQEVAGRTVVVGTNNTIGLCTTYINGIGYSTPSAPLSLMCRIYGTTVNVTTSDATEVSGTTAILHGDLNQDIEAQATCGFWIGNATTNATNWEQNITVGNYHAPSSFSYIATGLNPGQYYHCRAWATCTGCFVTSTDETYFMTIPDPPSGANINLTRSTYLHLRWTNQTCVASNQTTVVRMSTTSYPTSPTSGTSIYNGTAEWCNASGLTGGTDYYFSLWTYVNDSGSPFLWEFSDSYETLLGSTNGSTYNVQVRWECDGTWVNLSDVTLDNEFTAYNLENELVYKGYPNATDGNFSFTPTDAAAVVRFRINDTGTRSVVIPPGEINVTIWLPCGELGTDWGDLQLVTIFFRDFTGSINRANHAYGYLYIYNNTGVKTIIHSDYLQADVALRTPCGIGNTYYIGVTCDLFSIDPLGPITIIEEQYEIDLVAAPNQDFVWWQLFDITYGWTAGNLAYVDFLDNTYNGVDGVSWLNLTISDMTTGVEQYTTEPLNPWDFYASTPVTNYIHNHLITMIVMYNATDENWVQTITLILKGKIATTPMTSDDAINDMLNDTIGGTPVFIINPDGTMTYVSWAGVILAFIVTGVMFLFSREFAGLGPIIAGLVIAFFNVKLGISANTTIVLAIVLFMIGAFVLLLEYRRR